MGENCHIGEAIGEKALTGQDERVNTDKNQSERINFIELEGESYSSMLRSTAGNIKYITQRGFATMYQTNRAVSTILIRDLSKVIMELDAFSDEQIIWVVDGTINNSAGNLALHISGAVSHFIGAVLGKNGYVRAREKEFGLKDVPRDKVIEKVRDAIGTVATVLPSVKEEHLDEPFPERIGDQILSIGFFLTHLVSHVNYHLGQINYHRRLVERENTHWS